MSRPLQLTLAILKPDVVSHPHILQEVRQKIINSGFYILKSKHLYLPRAKAAEFYEEHEGRFFHNRLVSFMSSGNLCSQILAREDAIIQWRKLMGPTKVFQAVHQEPNSIRGQFGLTDTRNATHGSDSEDNAQKEIKFFFPEFDIKAWMQEEELMFRSGQVEFCEERGIHLIKGKSNRSMQL